MAWDYEIKQVTVDEPLELHRVIRIKWWDTFDINKVNRSAPTPQQPQNDQEFEYLKLREKAAKLEKELLQLRKRAAAFDDSQEPYEDNEDLPPPEVQPNTDVSQIIEHPDGSTTVRFNSGKQIKMGVSRSSSSRSLSSTFSRPFETARSSSVEAASTSKLKGVDFSSTIPKPFYDSLLQPFHLHDRTCSSIS
ncbi:hypothetical protein Dimus_004117 [Dionaea muscipula]